MEPEQVQDIQVQDTPAPEADVSTHDNDNQASVPEQDSPKQHPAGYHPVDLDGVDPDKAREIQDRFGYFFKQDKLRQREVRETREMFNEMQEILAQQSALIAELSGSQEQIVSHLRTTEFAETEAALTQQMNDAFERGDTKAYLDAQQKLIAFGVEKKLATLQKPKQQPQQKQQKQQRMPSASELGADAAAGGEISPEDAMTLEAWQSESDQTGQPIRPWAVNRGTADKPDMRYLNAVLTAQDVFSNPAYERLSFQQKLDIMDQRMGTQKRPSTQNVMGGNLTTPGKSKTITLSEEAKRIAVKTRFAGPGKSDKEHIEAYRKQIEEVKQRGAK